MGKPEYQISKQKLAHNGFLPIEEAEIKATLSTIEVFTYTRERVLRRDAVAMLLLNTDTNGIVLTEQFRYAIHDKIKDLLPEIPAGKVDEGESTISTALRETMEECGIEISAKNLVELSSFFASPGYTAEKYFLYFCTFSNSDKKQKGGGLATEHEFIHTYEIPVNEFYKRICSGEIPDAKTIMAGLLARQKGLI